MSPLARSRGLQAAAAVAALGACAPKGAPEAATPEPAPAETPAELAPEAPAEPTPEERVATCLDQTAEAAAEPGADMGDVLDCCRTLDAHFSEDLDRLREWPTRDACCAALNWMGGLACTPWGPPTPPSMPVGTA